VPRLLDRLLGRRPDTPLGVAVLGRSRTRGGLTAAGMLVDPDLGQRLAKAATSRSWQTAAYAYRRSLPEVGYVARWHGHNATHIRLYAGDRPPGVDAVAELNDEYDGNLPAELVNAAREAVRRLTGASPSGGGAAILAPLVVGYELVGEAWLVGRYDPATDREAWAVHSVSELRFMDGRFPGMVGTVDPLSGETRRGYYRLVTGEGNGADGVNLDPAYTTVYRLWTADPEWSGSPDSPMRSLVGVCERLLLIEKGDEAALRSRAAGNGVLLYPQEADSLPADPYGDDPSQAEGDALIGDLTTQLVTPLTRDGSAAQVVPLVHRMAADYIDKVKLLTMERPLDAHVTEREARLLARLGIGLDVPPEVITGLADTNHWNAWQIDDDSFKRHVEPVTIAAVEALTLTYLRSRLLDAGFEQALVERVVLWYDPAGLVAPTDMSDAANDAYDRGLISGPGWRELRGIDESLAPPEQQQTDDAPIGATGMTADRLRAVAEIAGNLIRAGFAADSVAQALGVGGIEHTGLVPVTVKPPEDGEPEPADEGEGEGEVVDGEVVGDSTDPPAITAAAPRATDEQRRLGRRLVQIEQALRERIAAAAAAAITRALERAGNRVRATGQRDEAVRTASAGVAGDRVTAAVGRALVAALGLDEQQLLADAFGRLREQYVEWTEAAAEEAIDTACRIAGVDRRDPAVARSVAELRDRYADSIAASWPTMEQGLTDLATERLYDPDPAAPPVGELPPTIVPPGLVRDALAVAGGLAAASTGLPPYNGLTSGELLDRFIRDSGAEVLEYEWVYGISARPFSPHMHLDGQVFAGFDDPVLSTAGTGHEWVGGSFAPGDHRGCHCDYAPIYSTGNTRDELELLGRRSYIEQNPDLPVPTRGATVDERVYLDPARPRPEPRRSAAAQAAAVGREQPPPPVPVERSRPAAMRTRRRERFDEAGVPYALNYEYLSQLDDTQLDDLAAHLAARLDDADPREGSRWDDLELYLAHREGWNERSEQLARDGVTRDADWQHEWDTWNDSMGRAGLTHEAERVPTRREVQEEFDLWLESYFLDAEREVRGVLLNAAGDRAFREGRLRDGRAIITAPIDRVARWASPELLSYMETHRRMTWSEFYYEKTGNPAYAHLAERARADSAQITGDPQAMRERVKRGRRRR